MSFYSIKQIQISTFRIDGTDTALMQAHDTVYQMIVQVCVLKNMKMDWDKFKRWVAIREICSNISGHISVLKVNVYYVLLLADLNLGSNVKTAPQYFRF